MSQKKISSAQWQVLNLNRNYSQVMMDYSGANIKEVDFQFWCQL